MKTKEIVVTLAIVVLSGTVGGLIVSFCHPTEPAKIGESEEAKLATMRRYVSTHYRGIDPSSKIRTWANGNVDIDYDYTRTAGKFFVTPGPGWNIFTTRDINDESDITGPVADLRIELPMGRVLMYTARYYGNHMHLDTTDRDCPNFLASP